MGASTVQALIEQVRNEAAGRVAPGGAVGVYFQATPTARQLLRELAHQERCSQGEVLLRSLLLYAEKGSTR